MQAPAIIETTLPIFPVAVASEVATTASILQEFKLIESDTDKEAAENLIKQGKALRKQVEEIRFSFTKPLDEKKKDVMQLEKELAGTLDSEVTRLTGMVNSYLRQQHQKAEERKKKLAEEEEARLKRLRSTSSIAKVQNEFEEKRAEIVAPTAGVRMQTLHELVDINLVPRELLMLDPVKVKAAIGAGKRDIPGLKIWEEPIRSGR